MEQNRIDADLQQLDRRYRVQLYLGLSALPLAAAAAYMVLVSKVLPPLVLLLFAPWLLYWLFRAGLSTNSHDRRLGAEAILRSLVDSGAVGAITTHDLAITAVAQSLDGQARNICFEDSIQNGELHFDYRVRPGVVRSSNALSLLRACGIDVGAEQ